VEARQGGTVTSYLRGLGPIAEQTGNQRLYYGLDALGSVRFLVNDHRHVVGQYTYSPFGEPYQENGLSPLYRYAGEPWTAGAGLTYLRARHYDPALGRILTRDSFPGLMGMPQTLNPYAYAGNNPVNLTDPSGHIWPVLVPIIGVSVVLAGGFVGGVASYTIDASWTHPSAHAPWNWSDALQAGKMGTRIASYPLFAAGGYLGVTNLLAAWGPAAAVTSSAVAEEAARRAPTVLDKTGQVCSQFPPSVMRNLSIVFPDTPEKASHITDTKHAWDLVVADLPQDVNEAYMMVQPLIREAVESGTQTGLGGGATQFSKVLGGQTIQVTGRIINGVFYLGNAWVRTTK
jgi:RHS repeat-associated protein